MKVAELRGELVGYLLRRGVSPCDMDDLIQEVLYGACLSAERFDPEREDWRAWVFAVARNQLSNFRRRARQRHEDLCPPERLDLIDPQDDVPTSEVRLRAQSRRDVLNELLAELPADHRTILIARDILEMELAEIAEALSLNITTVSARYRAARHNLEAAARRYRARQRHRGRDEVPVLLAPFRDVELRGPVQGGAAAGSTAGTVTAKVLGGAVWVLVTGWVASPDVQPHEPDVGRGPSQPSIMASSGSSGGVATPGSDSAPAAPVDPPPSNHRPVPMLAPLAPRAPASTEPFIEERELVEQAATALRSGQRHQAHKLLEQHTREFPDGRFAGRRDALLRELGAR
jgi:RNA polymerase sigma factor (sigma-70 family)